MIVIIIKMIIYIPRIAYSNNQREPFANVALLNPTGNVERLMPTLVESKHKLNKRTTKPDPTLTEILRLTALSS